MSFPVRLSGWPSQLLDFARFVAAGPGATEEELAEVSEEYILGGGRGQEQGRRRGWQWRDFNS